MKGDKPPIYVVRHGQTDWNVEHRFQGSQDIPINQTGRRQAEGNGRLLAELLGADAANYDYVSSPLGRSRETMRRIRTVLGLPADQFRIDERLIEVCFGDWEGHTLDELLLHSDTWRRRLEDRKRDKWNFQPPGDGAESYEILTWRVAAWFESIDRPTVSVSHGGIIRCLFHLVGGLDGSVAADVKIHQDRILRITNGLLQWVPAFDSRQQTA